MVKTNRLWQYQARWKFGWERKKNYYDFARLLSNHSGHVWQTNNMFITAVQDMPTKSFEEFHCIDFHVLDAQIFINCCRVYSAHYYFIHKFLHSTETVRMLGVFRTTHTPLCILFPFSRSTSAWTFRLYECEPLWVGFFVSALLSPLWRLATEQIMCNGFYCQSFPRYKLFRCYFLSLKPPSLPLSFAVSFCEKHNNNECRMLFINCNLCRTPTVKAFSP